MVEVSIVKCDSYSHCEPALRKAIDLLGGIHNFIKPKDKVLLKVNLLLPASPNRAITTHPKIVEAMIKIVQEAKGEPWIGDSSGGRSLTEPALRVTGIQKVAEEHGAKIMNFDKTGAYKIEIPKGRILKEIQIAKPVYDADCVVSMPKLKTHALTLYTGAIKNMFGTVPGGKKSLIHSVTGSSADKFAEAIMDIFSILPVHLNIMDGIVGMEGIGPNHGKPRKSNVVLASRDSIAMDSVASAIMGYSPKQIPTLRIAQERGFGSIDLDNITINGERIESVKTNYKKPIRIYKGLMFLPASFRNFFVETPRLPFPNPKGCNRCKICEETCPASAIKVVDAPAFDYKKCIRCYCCYEVCPENGIKLKKSLLR